MFRRLPGSKSLVLQSGRVGFWQGLWLGGVVLFWLFGAVAWAQTHLSSDRILVIANAKSKLSLEMARIYAQKRELAPELVLSLELPLKEEISRAVFEERLEWPLRAYLHRHHLEDRVLALVLMSDVPLKIKGKIGPAGDAASVDSELALLYRKMLYGPYKITGWLPNPLFGVPPSLPFEHDRFDIYLVCRLAGYTKKDILGLIDRALQAPKVKPPYRLVLDAQNGPTRKGDNWLHATYLLLKDRPDIIWSVSFDKEFITRAQDVIGYASWGSNDKAYPRHRRLQFSFLPGAVGVTFVSTNARTFHAPPPGWQVSSSWAEKEKFFAGSPQSLIADLIHLGITGIVGNVYEPYLASLVRPYFLFPLYLDGMPLGEAYYRALPYLSWQSVVIGDPLTSLREDWGGKSEKIEAWFLKRRKRFLEAQKRRLPADRIFLAGVRLLLGFPERALEELSPVLEEKEISPEVWNLLRQIGTTPELRAQLRKLLRYRQEEQALFLLALFHYEDHHYEEAGRLLKKLFQRGVSSPEAFLLAGNLSLREGRCQMGLAFLKKALRLAPKNKNIVIELYQALKKCGLDQEAQKLREKILSQPAFVELWPSLK